MTVEISLKKYKIFNLQKEYYEISSDVIKVQNHVVYLYNNLLLDVNDKNNNLGKLFELAKELNSAYNNFIIQECNSEEDDDSDSFEQIDLDTTSNIEKDNIKKSTNEVKTNNTNDYKMIGFLLDNDDDDEEKCFEKLRNFVLKSKMIGIEPKEFDNVNEKNIFSDHYCFPLQKIKNKLKEIMKAVGFYSIDSGLKYFMGPHYNDLISDTLLNELKYLDSIFIHTGHKIEDLKETSEFNSLIMRKSKNQNDDIIQTLVEIEVPFNKINKKIIFIGFFENDNIGIHLKTSQIANKYIYLLKKENKMY